MIYPRIGLAILFLNAIETIQIFTFEPLINRNFSYALLQGPLFKLPDRFVLCTSHLETTIHGKSFFTIFGENGRPWLSVSIWIDDPVSCALWATIRSSSTHVIDIKQVWLNFWIHICIRVDIESDKLIFYVNGELPIVKNDMKLVSQKPVNLNNKLFLGLSSRGFPKDPQQFDGSVTNVKIFEDDQTEDIQLLVKNLCLKHTDIVTINSE